MPTISERDEMLPMGMKPPKKFCIDCQWVASEGEDRTGGLWQCKHPDIKTKFDLVTGNPLPNYCINVRIGDQCGPAGNLWKPVGGSEGPY